MASGNGLQNSCTLCGKKFSASHLLTAHLKKGCDQSRELLTASLEHMKQMHAEKRRKTSSSTSLPLFRSERPTWYRKVPDEAGIPVRATVTTQILAKSAAIGSPPESPNSTGAPATALAGTTELTLRNTRVGQQEQGAGLGPPPPAANANAQDDLPLSLRKARRTVVAARLGKVRRDRLPEALPPNLPRSSNGLYAAHKAKRDALPRPVPLESHPNSFSLRRRYYSTALPSHDPEEHVNLANMYDSRNHEDSIESQPTPPPPTTQLQPPVLNKAPSHPFGPFPNLSSFELGEWYVQHGGNVSVSALQDLVKLIQNPGFAEGVAQTNWPKALDALGSLERDHGPAGDWMEDDGWKTSPISIPVPISGITETHNVGTLFHRNIVTIIQEKIANNPDMDMFHYEPYEVLWQPDETVPPTRVRAELYDSDAFLKAHRELQDSPHPAGCTRPRVVVGLMFASDETHLTSFTDEKLWPCYMFFGNESKYRRCKPSLDLCHHVAYFGKLSDDFKDYVTGRCNGRLPPKGFMAHCKSEMTHAQWTCMLDEELLDAIKNGIVIMCQDGIERRFYIRIFTYSADYPEKVLLATIRTIGHCPCPRCLVPKRKLDQMGTPDDMLARQTAVRKDDEARQALVRKAREEILIKKRAISGPIVDNLLKPQSLQPILNAFSRVSLMDHNFDIFLALVVDLMHEFESGVWKATFIHLLRILEAVAKNQVLIHELDKRFRQVPRFGQAIRRFAENVSELKRKAARDYEALLQCAIPVFDSLLPNTEHGKAILSLLALCAEWHALAKLRMHTDDTLAVLESRTAELGQEFRDFVKNVCSQLRTQELAAEILIRERRERNKEAKRAKEALKREAQAALQERRGGPVAPPGNVTANATQGPAALQEEEPRVTEGIRESVIAEADGKAVDDTSPSGSITAKKTKAKKKGVTLNIKTPKFHFLGDYPSMIRAFGTSDSFSTELSEKQHPHAKRWWRRSSRNGARQSVARYERKVARVKAIRRSLDPRGRAELEEQKTAARNAAIHHFIGTSENDKVSLLTNPTSPADGDASAVDPLGNMFELSSLQLHLVDRVVALLRDEHRKAAVTDSQGDTPPGPTQEYSPLDPSRIYFKAHTIYSHRIMRVKFTTYDVRRDEDVIHVDTDMCNVMIPNPHYPENPQAQPPYLYGRVLGIYHANVSYFGEIFPGTYRISSVRVEFLWVRWYDILPPQEDFPFRCLAFCPITSPEATSFMNPDSILRAAHIIPRFHSQRTYPDSSGQSEMARDRYDWNQYYVNQYADRDMFMRYHIGLAPGHLGVWPSHIRPPLPTPPWDALHNQRYGGGGDAREEEEEETEQEQKRVEEVEDEEVDDSDRSDLESQGSDRGEMDMDNLDDIADFTIEDKMYGRQS